MIPTARWSLVLLILSFGCWFSLAEEPASAPPEAATVQRLKAIILPELSFKNAEVNEVVPAILDASRAEKGADKLPKKEAENLMLMVEGLPEPSPRITIQLEKVSLYQALKFVASVSDLTLEFGEDTVTLRGKAPFEIRIAERLTRLEKALALEGDKAVAFQQAVREINQIAAEAPKPPPPFPQGLSPADKDPFGFDE